jgi:hypothetical protein
VTRTASQDRQSRRGQLGTPVLTGSANPPSDLNRALLTLHPGFELSKNKWGWGLTSAYSLSLSLHTGDSASLTTAGGGG